MLSPGGNNVSSAKIIHCPMEILSITKSKHAITRWKYSITQRTYSIHLEEILITRQVLFSDSAPAGDHADYLRKRGLAPVLRSTRALVALESTTAII